MNPIFDASRSLLGLSDDLTARTLEMVQRVVGRSMTEAERTVAALSRGPLLRRTALATKLAQSQVSLDEANHGFIEAMDQARQACRNAFRVSQKALDAAQRVVHSRLLENIAVASIVGESFGGAVRTCDIRPAFRLDGRDVAPSEVAERVRSSKRSRVTLCVPGLLKDETMWAQHGSPRPLQALIEEAGAFPLLVRFNPGAHISSNGRALLELMTAFLAESAVADLELDVLTYSLGGLIFRSALYQGRRLQSSFGHRVRRALLVSSPDGGSYLEKIGFWLGLTLEALPVLGFVANQRSAAIKDLSHGIIREEDWRRSAFPSSDVDSLYFGELDEIDATQAYSIISETPRSVAAYLGDGIVELPSLTLLSDRVYRSKRNPDTRVHCLLEAARTSRSSRRRRSGTWSRVSWRDTEGRHRSSSRWCRTPRAAQS